VNDDNIAKAIAAIGVILVLAVIFIGGWKLHWWLANSAANHQTQITNNGVSNQSGLQTEISQKVNDIAGINLSVLQANAAGEPSVVSSLDAQRVRLVEEVCNASAELTRGGYANPAGTRWISLNCLAGTIRPGSPYDAINP
jgi:hypothetical protein